MNSKKILTASLLSLVTAGVNAADVKTISKSSGAGEQVSDHQVGQYVVKCVGAAKGGENDCGALDGSHPCAAMSKVGDDNSINEWVYLTLEECAQHENGHLLSKDADGKPTVLSKVEFQMKKIVK